MIKNDRQYQVTKTQLREFENSLREIDANKLPPGTDPLLVEVQRRALESQRDELLAMVIGLIPKLRARPSITERRA